MIPIVAVAVAGQGEGDARRLRLALSCRVASRNDVDLVPRLRLRLQQRNCLVCVRVVMLRRGMRGSGTVLAAGACLMLCVGQIVNWRGILQGVQNKRVLHIQMYI